MPTTGRTVVVAVALALALGAASPAGAGGSAVRAHASAQTVTATLLALQRGGAITAGAYAQYRSTYVAAQRALGRLSGTRRSELLAVLEDVRAIAAAGELTASRAPALFLTLERNRQWWSDEQLLNADARISFPGSRLVWQYYPGQGLQIQWLGTFGEANGYFLSGHENASLRAVLAEALPLAAQRAGGIAWEYEFIFDGGSPPWTSGLSQGTALQVLARAWQRFKEPAYLAAAQQALGIFATPPPQGVRVDRGDGVEYAEYSYAPGDRILNGFIQALVGLYDYASITGDPRGRALFEAGDAQARVEVPYYDTGAWSRYDQHSESTLGYHELLTEFLEHLCQRTRKGPPLASTATTPAAPIAADEIYCRTAQRFSADLHTPPVVALLTKRVGANARAGVQISLSKVSNVTLTIRQGGHQIWRNEATVEGGRPRLLWVTPKRAGRYAVNIVATDPAGNFATANGTIAVEGHA